jgi:transcription elongation factor GreA-like protein
MDQRTEGGIRMKLEKHIEYIREYIGKCIDGEQEFDIHELWEWLDTLVGEEE